MKRAAIIVAGGGAKRLGGIDKPWININGTPIIEHVVKAARNLASPIVIVGERHAEWSLASDVEWTLEEPRGGGPVAAIRAGLATLPADINQVLLLAADAPLIAQALEQLCAGDMTSDGKAILSQNRLQYLVSCVVRAPFEVAVARGGDSMHSVFDHLQIEAVPFDVMDADTWEDVARIRALAREIDVTDKRWLDEVSEVLGVTHDVDVDAILALTRDVAHNVERKNAPLTSYLLGYAAASQGLSDAEIAAAAAKLGARARERGAANG